MHSTPAGETGWKEGSWHRGGRSRLLSSFDHSSSFVARTLPPGIQFIESIRCLWDMCKSHESLQSSTDSPFVLFIISSCRACCVQSFVIWKSTIKTKQKGEAKMREERLVLRGFIFITALFWRFCFNNVQNVSKPSITDNLTKNRFGLE